MIVLHLARLTNVEELAKNPKLVYDKLLSLKMCFGLGNWCYTSSGVALGPCGMLGVSHVLLFAKIWI